MGTKAMSTASRLEERVSKEFFCSSDESTHMTGSSPVTTPKTTPGMSSMKLRKGTLFVRDWKEALAKH